MAGLTFVSLAVLSATFLVLLSHQTVAESPCPPHNPFCPVWVPCNYTEIQGPYCQDCNTRVICTAIGGLVRPCWLPHKKNCVDGQCVSNPSEECAPLTTSEGPTEGTDITTEGITEATVLPTQEPIETTEALSTPGSEAEDTHAE